MKQVASQMDLLELFAQATRFGGITVKVPEELQKVPLSMIPGAEELTKRDIELYVKDLTLKDIQFGREKEPLWMESRPALPVLLRFATLGLNVEAKTKLGRIPLGATFRDGVLPFDFLLNPHGYDIGILPDRRTADANLDNLKLSVGGPLASGIANTFFKDDVARLVMKYGMGQTLKMSGDNLLGGPAAAAVFGLKKGSDGEKALSSVIDLLGGKKK